MSLVVAQEYVERLDQPIAGGVRIDLKVQRPSPMTSDSGLEPRGEVPMAPQSSGTTTKTGGGGSDRSEDDASDPSTDD